MNLGTININGKKIKISKSERKSKQLVGELPSGKKIHFADPEMKEFPGTDRGDNYCSRSLGIEKKYDPQGKEITANDLSRALWSCKGKKSISEKKFFGKTKGGLK